MINLLNVYISDEADINFHEFDHDDIEGSTINPHECNYSFIQNEDLKEKSYEGIINNDGNLEDQFLYPESVGVIFKYDSSDLFNCASNIILPCLKEPGNTAVAAQDSNGFSFETDTGNNYNVNNQTTYESEPCLNEDKTDSNNNYFECSTNLPMTEEELLDDIQNHLSSEQNIGNTSIYEYTDIINDTTDNQSNDRLDCQDYSSEQNQLFQNLDFINPIDLFQLPNIAPPEEHYVYQCNDCSFYTHSLHGLSVHKRVHSDVHFSCTECNYTTTKAYNLKQHQIFCHGTFYSCGHCEYVTQSSSKIRLHLRKKH